MENSTYGRQTRHDNAVENGCICDFFPSINYILSKRQENCILKDELQVSMSWEAITNSSGLPHGIAFNFVKMKLIPHLPFSVDTKLLEGMRHICSILNPLCLGQILAHGRHLVNSFKWINCLIKVSQLWARESSRAGLKRVSRRTEIQMWKFAGDKWRLLKLTVH